MIPTLVLDGKVVSFHHPSQLASALGLPTSTDQTSMRLARDIVPLMEGWLAHLEAIDWHVITKATPVRGRNLVDMTVNVYHPIALAIDAWTSHSFDWQPPADDDAITATMQKPEDVRAYAASVAATSFPITLMKCSEVTQ